MYSIIASGFFVVLSFFYVTASDKSPEGYLDQLRQSERGQNIKKKNRFNFCSVAKRKGDFKNIGRFMNKYDCQDYLQYFAELASSRFIGDCEKFERWRVLIPAIEQLKKTNQETKDEALRQCLQEASIINYPIARLLLAAIYNIRANLNQEPISPLRCHLKMDDIPMISYALDFGANPNTCHALKHCRSIRAAKLLLNPSRKHRLNLQTESCAQVIADFCCDQSAQKENGLLEYLLGRVELDHTNKFGKQWIDAMSKFAEDFDPVYLLERVELLLKHGCYYDEQTKKTLFSAIHMYYENHCDAYYKSPYLRAGERLYRIGNLVRARNVCRANLTELFERYSSANIDAELSINGELF